MVASGVSQPTSPKKVDSAHRAPPYDSNFRVDEVDMRNLFLSAILIVATTACAPIEHQETLIEGSSAPMTVGVGDIVAKVEKTRDLKNAFGAADIWGRKTNEGYAELRFAGVRDDGSIVLFRRDVTIHSDEDTLTRSGLGFATTNTTAYGSGASASATSSTIFAAPRQSSTIAIPVVVPAGKASFPFQGKTIEVIRVDSLSFSYRIIN